MQKYKKVADKSGKNFVIIIKFLKKTSTVTIETNNRLMSPHLCGKFLHHETYNN